MAEKPTFPKISLKYSGVDAFAKAARKCFEKGRLTIKLKRDFENKQKVFLIFQLGDREKPVEIIGQVVDRVPAKDGQGFNYGINFLNFSEKKLNRLIAGEELKPAVIPEAKPESSEQAAPAQPQKQTPQPPKMVVVPAPAGQVSGQAKSVQKAGFEMDEEEITIQAGFRQTFDGQPAPEPEAKQPEQAAVEVQAKKEAPREPEPAASETAATETIDKFMGSKREEVEPRPVVQASASQAPEAEQEQAESPDLIVEEEPEPEQEEEIPQAPAVAPQAQQPGKKEAPPPEEFVFDEDVAFESDDELGLGEEPAPAQQVHPQKVKPVPAQEPQSAPAKQVEEAKPQTPAQAKPTKEAAPTKPREMPKTKPVPAPEPAEEDNAPEEIFEAPDIVEAEEIQTSEVEVERAIPKPAPPPAEPVKSVELKPIPPKLLSDFLFRFCKMILNPPDPQAPDASKNFISLFEDFQKMMETRDRLGIYLALTQAGKDFILEGVQPSARSIRVVLPPDLSGTLLFRMIEVFDQKELVGIIFRKFIDFERFKNFILNVGKFNPEKETADALALRLIYMGVYHFNLVFETDLVAVPAKIEEETKIILARFSGELKRLRSLANQISEEPLALLTLRVEDILKFVSSPVVVAQMLEHLPLVWAGQVEEFDFDEFEDQILFSVAIPLLLGTFEVFARKISEAEKTFAGKPKQKEAALARQQRVLRRVMARIAYEAPEQALEPLANLFEKNVIRYEELPGEIRNQIGASMLSKNFLKEPRKKIADLDLIKDAKTYNEVSGQLIWAAVALLETENKKWSNEIFQKFVAHYQEKNPPFPERPKLAREVLKTLSEPTAIEILIRLLEHGRKEDKELSAAMLYGAGESAAKRLIAALETSEDRHVRRMICEILFRYGEKAAPVLLEELSKPDISWYLARNMLMVFSEIKSQLARERALAMLKHPHHRVREEALGYLFSIGQEGMEQMLADALRGKESSMLRRALACFAKMEAVSEESLNRIYELAKNSAAGPPDSEKDIYFQQAIELLARSSIDKFRDGTALKDFLQDQLQQSEKGLFSRAKLDLSPKMKVALIEALGRRKVGEAGKLLSKLAKDKDAAVRKAAQKSLEEIG